MGKSTVAAMFEQCGVPVFDADAEVHQLQRYDKVLIQAIEQAFPGTTSSEGVDRQALGKLVFDNPEALKRLEAIVHPAVAEKRQAFLNQHRLKKMVVLDIPLLFEKGGGVAVDVIVVVSAPPHIQRERVLARSGMTVEKFEAIDALQLPDAEKRARADFVISTGFDKAHSYRAVKDLVRLLSSREY